MQVVRIRVFVIYVTRMGITERKEKERKGKVHQEAKLEAL